MTVRARLRDAFRLRDERGEDGVVVVWLALLIVLLLAFAGWAVDYAHWNDERTKMQKAADAAALAGAVYLPDDPAGAISAAKAVASENGYASGVNVAILQNANQLQVTVSESVKNSFAQVIGIGDASLTKSAKGEYESPQPVDLVLILDRTGSMNGTPLSKVRAATQAFLKYLQPKNESIALALLGQSYNTQTCTGANAGAYGVPITGQGGASANGTWMAAPYPLKPPVNDYQTSTGALNPASQIVKTVNCLYDDKQTTDLGDPVAAATSYLKNYGRPGAKQGIVLMTDGAANQPDPGTMPCSYANDKATAAKAAGIQVLTIGFFTSANQPETCVKDTSGAFRNAPVTQVLASMASPIKGVPANNNGCVPLENTDGDNFFCEPKDGDITSVFLAAAAQITGRHPRLVP